MLFKNILCLLFVLALSQNGWTQSSFRVMIDAGHGGKDRGTSGTFSKEKDIVLDIAKRLQAKTNNEVQVILTRDSDQFLKLRERSEKANAEQIDLFISLHCNHIHLAYINGTEVYVYGHSDNEDHSDIVNRENGEENIEIYENHTALFILEEISESAYLEQSLLFGTYVSKSFENDVTLKQRGLRQANFRVLKDLTMPGVLIELAYLSNPENEKYINSEKGKSDITDALWRSILQYKRSFNLQASAYSLSTSN